MGTFVIALLVGFIAFIAGRAMVGSNHVTTEMAKSVGMDLYSQGINEGSKNGFDAGYKAASEEIAMGKYQAIDAYITGIRLGMKTVREHGEGAERELEDEMSNAYRLRKELGHACKVL